MNYIQKINAEILEMKNSGAPRIDIQNKQQELDSLIERDLHDIKSDAFKFFIWN